MNQISEMRVLYLIAMEFGLGFLPNIAIFCRSKCVQGVIIFEWLKQSVGFNQ